MTLMKEEIRKHINTATKELFENSSDFSIEYPENKFGDYSANIAFALSKDLKKSPKEIAEKITECLNSKKLKIFEKIEVAGGGFINFFLSDEIVIENLLKVKEEDFGKGNPLSGKEILFEYTDPNAFKAFHIGHLMSNAIGESISRLAEFQGADVKRICYSGDVGLHVAKAIWGMIQNKKGFPHDNDSLEDKIKFISDAYVFGNTQYEESEFAKKEIEIINKKVFEGSDREILIYYEKGKLWSFEHFKEIFEKLGTKFDKLILESEVAPVGQKKIAENMGKVFEESDGAVVFKGEKHNLHTRVFLTSQGLPTYEAKELGLFEKRKELFPKYSLSFVVTANEQKEYMKVVVAAEEEINPGSGEKFRHITHGLLRFKDGKMSSRIGNVITGESLIFEVEESVREKIKDKELDEKEKKEISEKVAIAAIKYQILKQSPGKDIIFDKEKSISLEGDSGPYILYAYVRAVSILKKAEAENLKSSKAPKNWQATAIEKLILRFPDIVVDSFENLGPQKLAEYCLDLAATFNAFYAETQIVNSEDSNSGYKISIVENFAKVLEKGLWLLGISTVQKM